MLSNEAKSGAGLRHVSWFYQTQADYLAAIEEFVRAGRACGEPVLVAVPAARLPGSWVLPAGPHVTMTDMAAMGGNPARIIPALRAFCARYQGQRVRYLGESAWLGRSDAQQQETARHEALLNLAFAETEISIFCPYSALLPRSVITEARSTHPITRTDGTESDSADYLGTAEYLAKLDRPLRAPAAAAALEYRRDLRPVRALVAAVARHAGLSPSRCTDLVIAASEVAANTLRHTRGAGIVRLWATDSEVLCQFEDSGFITDPLAGHWRPAGDLPGGQGLWLVNQLCDLAEIRSSELGTTVRLHMYRRQ
ncbi:MAG TPA: sensor histidine kinase [Streptosporangiaceae bacterium]|nr:sensor histidine kinase [Streptosporangiaceae bacterium]